jgi:hypothetical protein
MSAAVPAARYALFLLVFTAVLAFANRYVFTRSSTAFGWSPRTRKAMAWLFATVLVTSFSGRVLELVWKSAPVGAVLTVALTFELAVILSAAVLAIGDVSALVFRRLRQRLTRAGEQPRGLAEPSVAEQDHTSDGELTRRSFLLQTGVGSAVLLGSSSALYGTLAGRHDYQLHETVLKLPGLSSKLDGFCIAQLSDVHLGQFVGEPELAAALDLLQRAKPDLIVLTGDLLDHDIARAQMLGRFARRIASIAPHGVAAVTGNHDFYAGVDEVVDTLTSAGVRVLRNQGEVIGAPDAGFALLGVDDEYGERINRGPDLQQAIVSLPRLGGSVSAARDLPRVLLCHRPSFFERASHYVALQLSGHTHGGQVNPLITPASWVLPHGWVAGRYELNGSALYVNSGFGTVGPPARIGAAPEVTRIILTS